MKTIVDALRYQSLANLTRLSWIPCRIPPYSACRYSKSKTPRRSEIQNALQNREEKVDRNQRALWVSESLLEARGALKVSSSRCVAAAKYVRAAGFRPCCGLTAPFKLALVHPTLAWASSWVVKNI